MKRTLVLLAAILVIQMAYSQGSIDIDTSIQMGVANEEHLKITNTSISIHPDVGQTPLIFGDFSSGKIGIGTPVPGATIDIAGDMHLGTIASGGTIWFKRSDGNVAASLSSTPSNSEIRLASGGGSSFVTLQGHPTSGHIKLNPDGGNVGIGTTSAPSEKLEVNGNVKINGNLEVNGNGMVQAVFGVNQPTTIDMNNYAGTAWEVVGIRHLCCTGNTATPSRTVKFLVTLRVFASGSPKPCQIDLIGGDTAGWGGSFNYNGQVTTNANACTLTAKGSYIYWFYRRIY